MLQARRMTTFLCRRLKHDSIAALSPHEATRPNYPTMLLRLIVRRDFRLNAACAPLSLCATQPATSPPIVAALLRAFTAGRAIIRESIESRRSGRRTRA